MIRGLLLFVVLLLPSIKAHAGYYYSGNCYPDATSYIGAITSGYPKFEADTISELTNIQINATTGLVSISINSYSTTSTAIGYKTFNVAYQPCTATIANSPQDYAEKTLAAIKGTSGVATSGTASSTTFPLDQVATVIACVVLFAFGFLGGRGGQ